MHPNLDFLQIPLLKMLYQLPGFLGPPEEIPKRPTRPRVPNDNRIFIQFPFRKKEFVVTGNVWLLRSGKVWRPDSISCFFNSFSSHGNQFSLLCPSVP